MVKDTSVLAMNERLARKIRREGKKSNSKYAKKYVGIVSGEVVIIADSLDDAANWLRKVETDSTKCYIVDVAADYDRTYEV